MPRFANLFELTPCSVQHVRHVDRSTIGSRTKRGAEDNVLDVAASDLELLREPVVIQVRAHRGLAWKVRLPDQLAADGIGKRKIDDTLDPPGKRLIHVLAQIGGENHDALIRFHALQQVAGLNIGIAVVRVGDFRPLAKQRVRLIKEENCIARFGFVEDLRQVLLRLADIFIDHAGEVDFVQIEL